MIVITAGWVLLAIVLVGVPLLFFAFRFFAGATKRQRRRECPACGAYVKRGRTTCSIRSYDFAQTVKS